MDIRFFPKILLWMMLVLSSLGAVSFWIMPDKENQMLYGNQSVEQQMAISTAINFSREWMSWYGDESSEDRIQRLKPYVNNAILTRISQIKAAEKGNQQKVIASEFVALKQKGNHRYTVRVRVIALSPARTNWEIDVPVEAQIEKGATIMDSPVIRTQSVPPRFTDLAPQEPIASNEIKQRMRSTIENFTRAMCEGNDVESLANYVSTGSSFVPLQGRLKWVSLDGFEASGNGPYSVKIQFTVQDASTGFSFTQIWRLRVLEENQKFFFVSFE